MSYRAGFLGLIGQPNAGKSTLLNNLVEEKVSIVTDKPQTTRRRMMGFLQDKDSQIILVDAPGVLKAGKGLNSFLQKEAEDVIQSSDALCAVFNLDEDKKENLDKILEMVVASKKPWFAILTKVDLVEKTHRRERLRTELRDKHPSVNIIEFSNSWKSDMIEFRRSFVTTAKALLPESPAPLYDTDSYTPHTVKELACEIVREKCFEELQQEIPYQLAVRITKFEETDPALTKIYAEIVISKESHKPIIIGKGGTLIKKIGMSARKDLEKLMGHKVFLSLDVVVREEWFENGRLMKELGYVVIKE